MKTKALSTLFILSLSLALAAAVVLALGPGHGAASLANQDDDGLWITQVNPSGGTGHPFDLQEIQFSAPVQDDSFTLNDVSVIGPGGPITPAALVKLADDLYQLDYRA